MKQKVTSSQSKNKLGLDNSRKAPDKDGKGDRSAQVKPNMSWNSLGFNVRAVGSNWPVISSRGGRKGTLAHGLFLKSL
jgi:hypothetical protein